MILHGRRDKIAVALVEAIVDGRVQTKGQIADVIAHAELLPPRLRSWTLAEIRQRAGDEIADLIENHMQVVPGVPA
jgi:sirohydrochlorin ferrochelatase